MKERFNMKGVNYVDYFDFRVKTLLGIAASVAGHYEPCFEFYLEQARKKGVPERAIRGAISIARSIRKTGQHNMDTHVQKKLTRA